SPPPPYSAASKAKADLRPSLFALWLSPSVSHPRPIPPTPRFPRFFLSIAILQNLSKLQSALSWPTLSKKTNFHSLAIETSSKKSWFGLREKTYSHDHRRPGPPAAFRQCRRLGRV
ncbi:MAG: hypothetical protein BYD32DRAFT_398545, partial [Podila humilis]